MQLLHEHQAFLAVKEMNTLSSKSDDKSSDHFEAKEKPSNSSLLMNPVASGDNVATVLNSTHKDEMPTLVPCCEGKELLISEDLVRSGLSAISVKHDSVIQCVSLSHACEKLQVLPGLVKHRNSFRSLHRPDLKRVPYLRRMTPDELETLFRGYSDVPTREQSKNENHDISARVLLPPDDDIRVKDRRTKEASNTDNAGGLNALHPILEARSGVDDIPVGMRLHGARARLYTSVLAGARAGDQVDGASTNEEYDTKVPDEIVPEDEVLNEELQIILPPRCDDVTAESSGTTADSAN